MEIFFFEIRLPTLAVFLTCLHFEIKSPSLLAQSALLWANRIAPVLLEIFIVLHT